MEVALLTVGDELLAGDTVNTNATWLAERLSERGVTVARILTIPDERALIAEWVRTYSDEFDAVIVTGGLGGTPDDVTIDAVADAFDRDLVVSEQALAAVEERLADIGDAVPDFDLDRSAAVGNSRWAKLLFDWWRVVRPIWPVAPDEMRYFDSTERERALDWFSEKG